MPFRIVEENIPEEETQPTQVEEVKAVPKFRIIEQPETKEEQVAKSFKFFGYQPSPETIKPIRHFAGVTEKGLAKGLIGSAGEILDFGRRLMGIKEPTKVLPNTEDIGKMFDTLGGEEFNPENISEEIAQRGAEFLGSILGLGGPLKGASIGKSLGRTILGAFAPAGVSLLGEKREWPAWAQAASTIGTSFLTHRLTGKSIREMKNALYQKAENLSKDAMVSSKGLKNNLLKQKTKISKGGTAASDTPTLPKINELLKKTKADSISIEELMATKRKINEARGTLFAKDLGKAGVKTARKNLNDLSKNIDTAISEFKNPEFQQAYKQANQIHGGMAANSRISQFIFDHPALSGVGAAFLKFVTPGALKTIGTVAGAGQMAKFFKNIAKNPGYRKAYFNVLKNAAKEEVKGTAGALKRFNKEQEKADKKD